MHTCMWSHRIRLKGGHFLRPFFLEYTERHDFEAFSLPRSGYLRTYGRLTGARICGICETTVQLARSL
jgi:hypothetical protein